MDKDEDTDEDTEVEVDADREELEGTTKVEVAVEVEVEAEIAWCDSHEILIVFVAADRKESEYILAGADFKLNPLICY